MFIRKQTFKTKDGQKRGSYSLLECKRVNGMPKQFTVLNLGGDFTVEQQDWAEFCAQVRARLIGEPRLPMHDPAVEAVIEHVVTQLRAKDYDPLAAGEIRDKVLREKYSRGKSRSVGGERVALAALEQLGLVDVLRDLKLTERHIKLACALVVGRMLSPGSELHAHRWMHTQSTILELLELPACSYSTLHRVGDQLWKHHEAITGRLFDRTRSLFSLTETIVFYDLTNTYTYGGDSDLRQYGRSKEKRSDLRLVTLALTLDASGFPRGAEILPGNASEPGTLKAAIERLQDDRPTIIMDAGLATAANLEYLEQKGLPYLCVTRTKAPPAPDREPDHRLHTRGGEEVSAWSYERTPTRHRVYMLSAARKRGTAAMLDNRRAAFEAALQDLHEGLSVPRRTKSLPAVQLRLGRLCERHCTVSYQYDVTVIPDEDGVNAQKVEWVHSDAYHHRNLAAGGTVLQTSHVDWSLDDVVRTYWRQLDIERTFRCLKSELGVRPIFHWTDPRIGGHIFISILAYHVVQLIRTRLKKNDVHGSWTALRDALNGWRRATTRQGIAKDKAILQRCDDDPDMLCRLIAATMGVPTHGFRVDTLTKS